MEAGVGLFKIMVLFFVMICFSLQASAWGKRGHSLVCETAAYIASVQESRSQETHFLKLHSFDLGYYCNVPDLIWKRPGTYKKESINHFMNLEHFERSLSKEERASKKSPFHLSRKEFDKKYKNISERKGRSWWRIQELDKDLAGVAKKLKNKKLTRKQHQALQVQWLTLAGVMGHYVGDLAMPLHVSENYDGVMTGQKGLHHYFEETMVDELYLDKSFGLQARVYQESLKLWPGFLKKAKNKDLLSLIQELSSDSQKAAKKLLTLDKKMGRKNFDKALNGHKDLVVQRLTQGVLYQAYMFHKHLGWDYNGNKFYDFAEKPKFIEYSK